DTRSLCDWSSDVCSSDLKPSSDICPYYKYLAKSAARLVSCLSIRMVGIHIGYFATNRNVECCCQYKCCCEEQDWLLHVYLPLVMPLRALGFVHPPVNHADFRMLV